MVRELDQHQLDQTSEPAMIDQERRQKLIDDLIKDGMAPDIAPRALDAWMFLLDTPGMRNLAVSAEDCATWAHYGFMQGFVAGYMVSVHHN
jgi:hypothetical protein